MRADSLSDTEFLAVPTRHPDWEPRLEAVVRDWAGRSYAWGTADCGRFASACVEAVSGSPLWPKIGAYSSEAGLARALKRAGFSALDEAVSAVLGESIPALAAHRGDVLWDGQAIGVMTGAGPMVFGEDGLVLVERADLKLAWPVGRSDAEPADG